MAGVKGDTAGVAAPLVFGGDELNGGAVVFFRLPAHEADGFVQQNGYAVGLLFVGLFVEVYAVGGADFLPEHGGDAVYAHPAFFYVAIGFAA